MEMINMIRLTLVLPIQIRMLQSADFPTYFPTSTTVSMSTLKYICPFLFRRASRREKPTSDPHKRGSSHVTLSSTLAERYRSVSCREILRCVSDLYSYMLNYVSHNKRLLFFLLFHCAFQFIECYTPTDALSIQ